MPYLYDLKAEPGHELLEMEDAQINELLAAHGDRYSRSPPSKIIIFDCQHQSGRGAAELLMDRAAARHAIASDPGRFTFERPEAQHLGPFIGRNRIVL